MKNQLHIGIDIGKRHDPSAIVIAVVEDRRPTLPVWSQAPTPKGVTHYRVPFLQRLPLETPYPEQVKQLLEYAHSGLNEFKKAEGFCSLQQCQIMVDVTGVGDAVVDMLKPGMSKIGMLHPCRLVAGDRLNKINFKEYQIGKAHFVSRLQVLSESRLVHLPPDYPEAQQLAQEMLDFDIDVDETSGKATFGAMRPGTHDDLVCALGLACLIDPHKNLMTVGAKPAGL
jgi:hypothetical protein